VTETASLIERDVLATLLLWEYLPEEDRQLCEEQLARLTADDFADPTHRAVFAAVLDLVGAGVPVSLVTVTDRLRRGGGLPSPTWELDLTAMVDEHVTATLLPGHVDRLLVVSARRALLRLAHVLIGASREDPPPVEAVLQMTVRMLEAIRAGLPGRALAVSRPSRRA
jgi:replicative DNA helicase